MSTINEIPVKIDSMKHHTECIERIKTLFGYKLPSETKDCPSPVFIEVGGGSVHAKIYFDDRSEADRFCYNLTNMLEARIEIQKAELSNLCAEYLREQSKS